MSRSSNPSATYQVAASAVSLLEALPTEPGLSLSADTSVELTRAASDPSANGFAATEPGRLVRFESLGGELRLSYNLRGSSVVDNELPGNNSFARASLFVQNETTSTSIVNLQRFGPDAAGFSEQGVVTFFTQPDDIIAITLDIGSSAVIGNAETAVRVESFGSVAIDLVPEPGVGLCLAGCLLGLTRRRRTNRIR